MVIVHSSAEVRKALSTIPPPPNVRLRITLADDEASALFHAKEELGLHITSCSSIAGTSAVVLSVDCSMVDELFARFPDAKVEVDELATYG